MQASVFTGGIDADAAREQRHAPRTILIVHELAPMFNAHVCHDPAHVIDQKQFCKRRHDIPQPTGPSCPPGKDVGMIQNLVLFTATSRNIHSAIPSTQAVEAQVTSAITKGSAGGLGQEAVSKVVPGQSNGSATR